MGRPLLWRITSALRGKSTNDSDPCATATDGIGLTLADAGQEQLDQPCAIEGMCRSVKSAEPTRPRTKSALCRGCAAKTTT